MLQKLKRLTVEERLKSLGLTVFTPQEFRDIFSVSANTASAFIKNNVTSGLLIKLRNSFYLIKDSHPSHLFIANRLCSPSYISLETALSHYGIIPEVVYTTTSITTKIPREYETPIGTFSYQCIKKEAYAGYSLQEIDGRKVFIAEAEKALADHLYFVDLKRVSLNDRLELRSINQAGLVRWANLFQRPGLLKLVDKIYAEYQQSRKIY